MKPRLYIKNDAPAELAIKASINLLLTLMSESVGKEVIEKILNENPSAKRYFKWTKDD